jgi:UPF0755 protein
MPSKRKRTIRILLFFLLVIVICSCVWAGGVIALSAPRALINIGPASANLEPAPKALLTAYLLLNKTALDRTAGDPEALIELEITEGESAGDVAARLEREGIVSNGTLLRNYLRYRGLDVGIEAGKYSLSGAMTIRQIAESLQTAKPNEIVITVLEGWRSEQIAAALPVGAVPFRAEDFLDGVRQYIGGYSFSEELPSSPTLEGFLFPDTYLVNPGLSAKDFLRILLENFESKVDDSLREGFRQEGLSLYEAVTLASIVEREAVVSDERPIIASVFLNRLRSGMKLESDPTVQYALGLQPNGAWWKSELTAADLAVDSPYNTYQNTGLPPSPICNPGMESLRAIAFPAATEFYYFRATCDGSGRHVFAKTFEEHLNNACP